MLKTQGVVHFTIPVKDLDRSEGFYTEILGMERIRRNHHMVFMRAGADCFVLTHSESPSTPIRGTRTTFITPSG
jgi:catechol 2,3-dioxygenase-like lactoylglutathione lyase family enzyme